MRIINCGPKITLSVVGKSIQIPGYEVSDIFIANGSLLRSLVSSFSSTRIGLFIDNTIELNIFKTLESQLLDDYGNPKDGNFKPEYLSKYLWTDLDSAIKDLLEPAQLAYKESQRYTDIDRVKLEIKELENYKSNAEVLLNDNKLTIQKLTDEISKKDDEIKELSDALEATLVKVENMRNEFNAACSKFRITKDKTTGEWISY